MSDADDPDAIGDRMRADVDAELDRLRGRFGAFPVHEETVENEPDYFESGVELAREGWRGDAGAFVVDDDGRVVFIRHEGAPDSWGLPGGGHEPGEGHLETALREVREETGIEAEFGCRQVEPGVHGLERVLLTENLIRVHVVSSPLGDTPGKRCERLGKILPERGQATEL